MATPGGAYETAILADTPWAYWTLDDPTGPAASDSSGNGRAAVYGGPFVLQQPPAADFGGFSVALPSGASVVRAAGPAPAGSPLTLECWIATLAAPNAFSTLMGQGDAGANGMFLLNNSSATATNYSVHNPGQAVFNTGVQLLSGWHLFHLLRTSAAGVAGQEQLFIDGVQLWVQNPTTVNAGSSQIQLNTQGGTNGSNALYDEMAVYTAALSQTRMLAHLHAAGAVQGAPLGGASGVQLTSGLDAIAAQLSAILNAVQKTFPTT